MDEEASSHVEKENSVEVSEEGTADDSLGIHDLSTSVIRTLRQKHEKITVIIGDHNGHCINSTLPVAQAFEKSSCILDFTDKVKVLMRKVLPDEELSFVRIRGRTNEVIVTFNELLEIITIQDDKAEERE